MLAFDCGTSLGVWFKSYCKLILKFGCECAFCPQRKEQEVDEVLPT